MNSKLLLFSLFWIALGGCQRTPQTFEPVDTTPDVPTSKLERFLTLPKDSIYVHCDLSGDSIKEFPDLSEHTIRSLDLSHNQIKRLASNRLPKGLERLNVSHNKLEYVAELIKEESLLERIEEVNVSHNSDLRGVLIRIQTKRIYASHCNLKFSWFIPPLDVLDISFNPKMNNVVDFYPNKVNLLIHDHIANDEPMIEVFQYSLKQRELNRRKAKRKVK